MSRVSGGGPLRAPCSGRGVLPWGGSFPRRRRILSVQLAAPDPGDSEHEPYDSQRDDPLSVHAHSGGCGVGASDIKPEVRFHGFRTRDRRLFGVRVPS
ncbi:hypothetical protein DB31_7210 [Hyalangium minutum]|uniref:Uncharacterized protein n=1 Tax=Hyalangium minutum TaxID=394096 RepID=A0A085WJW0_9BACT|nr:hypothetical protein DB31_7210 [Hyalangium minutum]